MLVYNTVVSTFGSDRPSYQHILQLDTAIRNYPIISKMDQSDCAGKGEEGPLPPADVNIVRWLGMSNKESSGYRSLAMARGDQLMVPTLRAALLHLHRRYFSQVLDDQRGDILKHKYAPSFIAVFRSAWRLIRGICLTFGRVPEFLVRAGFCWSHAADAAVSSAPYVHLPRSSFRNA